MYLFYFFLLSFLPLSHFLYLFTYLLPLSSLAILLQSVLFFRNAFLLFDRVLISASSLPVVIFPFPTRFDRLAIKSTRGKHRLRVSLQFAVNQLH